MIGVDIVRTERIARAVKSAAFVTRVFTTREAEYCASKAVPEQSYAGIFAAKEAAVKAAGCGFTGGVKPTDIEILHKDSGAPYLAVHCSGECFDRLAGAEVSISHDGDYAIAVVAVTEDRK